MGTTSETPTFLVGNNAVFMEALYARYLQNPDSIDPSWQSYFNQLQEDPQSVIQKVQGASWAPHAQAFTPTEAPANVSSNNTPPQAAPPCDVQTINIAPREAHGGVVQVRPETIDAIRALMLIRAHRVRGHLHANLDPLGLLKVEMHPELDPASYGFGKEDFDRPIFIDGVLGFQTATLREIMGTLNATYCATIGAEYMHIQDEEQREWIQARIEDLTARQSISRETKAQLLESLTRAETFEKFLHTKYPGAKRFGLEGSETLIPAVEHTLLHLARLGGKEVVFGMAHRGRLNVLANIIGKSLQQIFSEFQGDLSVADDVQGSGDVKYHLGCSSQRIFEGREIHLSLTANPSHLEGVNPVVVGKVRAKQIQRQDDDRSQVLGILFHGDAAFAGQGIVPETLSMSELPAYRIGGTLHLVTNNQIGFTTSPQHSRSSPYCSDVAKMIQAPIFHVNGDDPEAVAYVCQMAIEFRQKFKKDVVVDLWGYRRHGHNEMDEPAFTQPKMYAQIAKQQTTRTLYAERLVQEGSLTEADVQGMISDYQGKLQQEFEQTETYVSKKADWLDGKWSGLDVATAETMDAAETGVPLDLLKSIGTALTHVPEGLTIHRRLERVLKEKEKRLQEGGGLDWATGEALAFGSLLCEGNTVRLSGQDCGRGTFSQRHSVFVDQETEAPYVPLNHIQDTQAEIEIIDSPLSELAVLGFEYGYSLAEPNTLVMWEAQFGDFANGAQMMIDQFISSGEAKWLRMSGVVMLLPHGYEGQGPEHSSARLERYLQLSAENNWQVANCTTPANYFHILRRQLRRNFRKPLIIMTPKLLLRHKAATSRFEDMGPGTHFQRVLDETDPGIRGAAEVQRVVLCSGKVYYDLVAEREERGLQNVAILRLEQLYPFPKDMLLTFLQPYSGADFVWCQEEPMNMGAWTFVDRRIEEVLATLGHGKSRPLYAGRAASASTATGHMKRHEEQQKELVDQALSVG